MTLPRSYRILHTTLSPEWGGPEMRTFTEMKAMRQRGHLMALAAPTETPIYQKCKKEGLRVFPLPQANMGFPWGIWKLKRDLERESFEVINTHGEGGAWLGGLGGRWAGTPCILRSEHMEVEPSASRMEAWEYQRLPHRIIASSEHMRERLIRERGLPQAGVEAVRTGIDLQEFQPATSSYVRRDLKLEPDAFLIGIVAVLRSWKGHLDLLEAVRHLDDVGRGMQVVFAGEGSMRLWIQEGIQRFHLGGRVQLLGHRADIPEILNSLDIVVVPSTAHEGTPQSVLQGQACGRCVVGTKVGGIPEVIRDGETGFLVEPSEPRALSALLGWLQEHPELRTRVGQAARRQAEAEHGLERMCEALEKIYARQILNPKLAPKG